MRGEREKNKERSTRPDPSATEHRPAASAAETQDRSPKRDPKNAKRLQAAHQGENSRAHNIGYVNLETRPAIG